MLKRISDSTIERLAKYYRTLENFIKHGTTSVSSDDLADQDIITSAQVRKDLSSFGTFGKRGIGYDTSDLFQQIQQIMGLDKKWNIAIVGAGNIGRALINFKEFKQRGFNIRGIFDSDPSIIGWDMNGLTVHNMDSFPQRTKHLNIHIGIIAVPSESAQSVADLMVAAGLKAILNFAPKNLRVPEDVLVRNANISINLEMISYHLTNYKKS